MDRGLDRRVDGSTRASPASRRGARGRAQERVAKRAAVDARRDVDAAAAALLRWCASRDGAEDLAAHGGVSRVVAARQRPRPERRDDRRRARSEPELLARVVVRARTSTFPGDRGVDHGVAVDRGDDRRRALEDRVGARQDELARER